jgi:hypothetical protein
MGGKPFQSKLEPHYDLIREARRNRQTWQAIVELLAAKGINTSRPAVYSFMKRRLKRRYPFGMAPGEPRPPAASSSRFSGPAGEPTNLTESLLPPSEFGPDPLTRSTKKKWNTITKT